MLNFKSLLLALALSSASLLIISCGGTKAPETATTGGQVGGTVSHPTYSYTRIRTSEPLIALTFDDGPSVSNTPKLLQILKDKDVRATFFMIGQNVAAHPDIVKQVAAAGHEIGSHTWSHPHLSRLSVEAVTQELQKTQDAIEKVTGNKPQYLRPPYGDFTNDERQWVPEIWL